MSGTASLPSGMRAAVKPVTQGPTWDGMMDDMSATILHCLGHGPDTHMHDTLNRPIPVSRGQVVRQILA